MAAVVPSVISLLLALLSSEVENLIDTAFSEKVFWLTILLSPSIITPKLLSTIVGAKSYFTKTHLKFLGMAPHQLVCKLQLEAVAATGLAPRLELVVILIAMGLARRIHSNLDDHPDVPKHDIENPEDDPHVR